MTRLFLGLLFLADCFGQNTGQNVVNSVTVPNAVYTALTTITSANLQNIGQTSHKFTVVVSNTTGLTGSTLITISLQASLDGISYFDIGRSAVNVVPNNITNGAINYSVSGYSAYPYIKTSFIMSINTGSVTLSGTYIGSSAPSFILSDTFGSLSGGQVIVFENDVTTNSGTPKLLVTGLGGSSNTIYGITVIVPTTVTKTLLFCSAAANGSTQDLDFVDIPASISGNLIWGLSSRAYIACPKGYYVFIYQTGTGTSEVTLNYRTEN